MINNLTEKILDLCNGNLTLLIILLTLLPLLELRIAIPFALSLGTDISAFTVFSIAISSTLISIPLMLLLLKPIFKLFNKIKFLNKISQSLENYFKDKASSLGKTKVIEEEKPNLQIDKQLASNYIFDKDSFEALNKVEKNSTLKSKLQEFFTVNRVYFYLFLFVALPFPLTGYYTGCAIAVFLSLNFYKSFISIFFGNIVAGIIITFFSSIFENSAIFILIFFLGLIVFTLLLKVFKKLKIKKSTK